MDSIVSDYADIRGNSECPDDPPVSPVRPWLDRTKIEACWAKDVIERINDDRTLAQRAGKAQHEGLPPVELLGSKKR